MRTVPPSQRQSTSIGLPAFSERATAAFARPNAITVRVIAFTPLRATVAPAIFVKRTPLTVRSEEHTSELQSLMRISYAVFCLKKKNINNQSNNPHLYTI